MKAPFYIVTLFMAFMVMGSCQQEVVHGDESILHTWEAKSFISVESVAYEKLDGNAILLTFNKDGRYLLKLDVNTCSGSFETGNDKSIVIDYPPCTERCCDSEFSNKLAAMLPKVTSYRITGDHLYLSVPEWGDIKLERRD